MERQGFVFINEEGRYAKHAISSAGFAPTREVIHWVDSINEATVFHNEKVVARKFNDQLAGTQCIKAVETKVVKLTPWSD